jgi:sugar phosphate isomerase/epimerase
MNISTIMRIIIPVLILAGISLLFSGCKKGLDNPVFPQNNAMRMLDNAPKDYEGQAALLKELGYDGIEAYGPTTHPHLRNALYDQGLKALGNYIGIDLDSTVHYDPVVEEIIANSTDGEVVYFYLNSRKYRDDRESGDEVAAEVLRKLADFATSEGVRLAVYPHVNNYCETVEHSVRIAKLVDRPNVGAMINLCHLLKVEGDEGYEQKVRDAAPYLVAATICGADNGETQKMGWDRLIQPLGSGTFDTYRFVKVLKDNGYNGPIGFQCYNIKGDVREVLTQSMNTWKAYQDQYKSGR